MDVTVSIIANPLVVPPDATVREAIARMSLARSHCPVGTSEAEGGADLHWEDRASCVLVETADGMQGILTERDIVRLSTCHPCLDPLSVGDVMMRPVITLRKSAFTDLFAALNLLQQHRIRHLPLVDDQNRLVGLLTHASLCRLFCPIDLLQLRRVQEVMTHPVVWAPPTCSMRAIAQLMTAHRISSVVIVESDPSRADALPMPVGIVTERDLVQFQALGLALDRCPVAAVMSTPVFTVTPDDSLWTVQQTMEQRRIQRLVVTEASGKLAGILTQSNLLQALNPLELLNLATLLGTEVNRLEAEKLALLESRTVELEHQVATRTAGLQAKAEREQLLLHLANRIRASLNLQKILETCVQEVRACLQCDRVLVYQLLPDLSGITIAESVQEGLTTALGDPITDTCIQQHSTAFAQRDSPIVMPDLATAGYSPCYTQLLEKYQVRASAAMPIRVAGHLWGLLIGHQCTRCRTWTPDDISLLQAISVQLAIAVQQATIHQHLQAELQARKQAERDLRASEQRYATLVAIAPVGIFRTDAQGHCIFVNERWCQIAGLTPTQALGDGWATALHPDDRERVAGEWYQAAQDDRPFQLEYRFQHRDGTAFWVYGQSVAERNAGGQVVSYVGTVTDISDRKATEHSLKVQRDFNQLIATITSRFVDLSPAALDAELDHTLAQIGQATDVDTTYLIRFSPAEPSRDTSLGDRTLTMTHEWCRSGYNSQIDQVQQIPLDAFPWANTRLLQRDIVEVPSVADLPPEAAMDQANWQQFHLVSVFSVPVIQQTRVTGLLGFGSFSQPLTWPEETIRLLQTLALAIANLQQRLQAEQNLHVSEERLRLALKAANQGLYDLNLQTGEAIVNSEYAIQLGYDPATFHETNAHWIERLHPEDRERVAATYQAYVAGDLPEYKVEFRQRTRQGEYRWILSLGQIVAWDGEGRPLRMLGTHTDITDRQQAEAERLQAEHIRQELNLLETMLDTLLIGYWDADLVQGRQYISPSFKRMFGYEDHELPNAPDTWKRLIFPEDLPHALAGYERHVQSHGSVPYYNELRYHHKNGSTVWVICTGQVIEWDAAGTPLRMLGCHIDITDRKQSEEHLRQLSARLDLAVKSAAIGIWDWDICQDNLLWDDRMYELYGLVPGEVANIYETWANHVHPDDRVAAEAAIQAAIRGEAEFDTEFRVLHPDGTTRFIKANAVVQRNDTGEAQRMIGINYDITARKRDEAQLQQSTTQLEASNRELEAFAYSVSHDLRAPLRAIDGFSKALLDDYGTAFDPEGQDYFDRIRKNVARMGLLIDDLLSLSRVSRYEIHPAPVNLTTLVHEIIDELRLADPERQVDVAIALNVTVVADATLMRVSLTNLIQNAWKFTSHHPTARIEFGVIDQAHQPIYFLRDDGAGFDMAYSKMLFGVFQRLHNTHEFPGTGIGLATVQRAIHRHGGQIWAEGAIEQGATFYFTIPPIPIHLGRCV